MGSCRTGLSISFCCFCFLPIFDFVFFFGESFVGLIVGQRAERMSRRANGKLDRLTALNRTLVRDVGTLVLVVSRAVTSLATEHDLFPHVAVAGRIGTRVGGARAASRPASSNIFHSSL